MYQALYRKWRPRTFDDVVGQTHITETLKNQIITGRLSHAYLFIGTRGTGKTTCAKILSRAVNCEHPVNGNPCNECAACRGIEDGSIMDVVELDAASNNGVDNVRALREEAVFTPAIVRKRVYIIDEVHMLSTPAFNALLKILEEPPEHLMFILATTELQKVPATILSRCQRHSFKRISADLIADHLSDIAAAEGLSLDCDAAALLSRLSDGGMRDAVSLLDQCSGNDHITTQTVLSSMGLAGNGRTSALLEAVSRGDTAGALGIFADLWRDGKDPATFLGELSSLIRDILMSNLAPNNGDELLSGGYDSETLSSLSAKLTQAQLLCALRSIQSALGAMRSGQSPRTVAEMCIIGLCEPDLSDDMDNLRSRISVLENALKNGVAIQAQPVSPAPRHAMPAEPPKAEPTIAPPDAEPIDLPWDDEPEMPPPYGEEELPPPPEDDYAAPPAFEEPPMPAAPAAPASAGSGDLWSDIIVALNGKIGVGDYNIISDSYHVSGKLDGSKLTLYAKNPFALGKLSASRLQENIRAAAQQLTGAPVTITVTEGGDEPSKAPAGNLDALGKFGNVKFE